ncbi:MAG: T9SS type A sorting domain-containing protein [Muribaculaceae bacterium]|nr:T9SS type A sorting domain-containing protein [Muribaculaceae bacterium]MBQ6648845.1 T9SS type A sorting domain-containing protein [Muribaculaceae bacterium]
MRRALYILTLSVALAVGSVSVTMVASPTRVEQVSSDETTVVGGKGTIAMVAGDGDTTFNIYSITGQLIKTVRVNAGTRVTIDMPKGFYIVKCAGRWSRKVVVK